MIGPRGEVGRGEGRSKKEAEQRAAEATLRVLLGADADLTREAEVARSGAAPAPLEERPGAPAPAGRPPEPGPEPAEWPQGRPEETE